MVEKLFPLSFAEQRLWFLNELEPGNAAYNLQRLFRISGTLDVNALAAAVQTLVSRHEGLRTVFTSTDGEPSQVILPAMGVNVPVIDLSALPEPERDERVNQIVTGEARKPFDLATGPLLRLTLIRLGREEHNLLLVMHHIITDGWSMSIFFRELSHFYQAFTNDRAPQLPELGLQYSDFTQWQREHVTGELLRNQIEYWKKKLEGADGILELPTDRPRPAAHSDRGASEQLFLENETAEKLKDLGQREGATLFMVLLAAFQTLLWRYTAQDTILVGTPTAGRNEVELENLIGLFVNTLVLRGDFSSNPTVRDLLHQICETAVEAYGHQDVPFEKLVEELKPERTLSRTPLIQVMLILQNTPRQRLELQDLVLEELEFESGIAKYDLTLEIIELDGLHCTFEYNSDIFDATTIQRMAGHFEALVNDFIQHPDKRVSELRILTEGERNQILVDWNNTAADYPKHLCIHTAFEQQVARTPDAVAFLYEGRQLTYKQLNERSNRVAHQLIQKGVRPGSRVGVSIEPSLEMVVGLMGILKAGAAYVPLDVSEPKQRLMFMLEDSKVEIIVTQDGFKNRIPEHTGRLLCVDKQRGAMDDESARNPSVPLSSGSVAYVIYTSGSTGLPKGVEGTHRASMNRFAWMWNTFPFDATETCCQKTTLSFVDSVWEIFGPLLRGIRNVIVPRHVLLDSERFIRLLAKYDVTRIVLVPSVLGMLLDNATDLAAAVPKLTLWSASGEVLTAELARRFRAAFPDATLLNIYGSSEVAADVTSHTVREQDINSVPIGKPISNTQMYILDPYLNPVPVGVRGQIHVGGDCLARGYWNRPDLTVERFIRNPFDQGGSTRLYKTGDLGRFLPDGSVDYVGRIDNQVKIRGFRVELGEIETVLCSHPSVRDAAVVVQGEPSRLIAYVGCTEPMPSAAQLRRFVQSKLPEYMVPSSYAVVNALPLLPSGKVNRKALPSLQEMVSVSDRTYVAPRTEIEKAIVEIWREVLKISQPGIEDNFFELGGHSLLAVQVISRVKRMFDVEISVRTIFQEPTISGLADQVVKANAAGLKARMPMVSRRRSAEQKEMLIAQLDKLSPDEVRALLEEVMTKKSSGQATEVQSGHPAIGRAGS